MKYSQTASIAATMVVSFVVAFAIMMPRHGTTTPIEEAALPPVAAPAALPQPVVTAPEVPAAPTPAAEAPPAPSPPNVAPDTELPVTVNVRNRRALDKVDALIANTSDFTLSITVEALTPSTQETSRIVVTLPPSGNQRVGVDDGLQLHPGDQLTLSSYPYRDRTSTVR